jgi:hypothetical protein
MFFYGNVYQSCTSAAHTSGWRVVEQETVIEGTFQSFEAEQHTAHCHIYGSQNWDATIFTTNSKC